LGKKKETRLGLFFTFSGSYERATFFLFGETYQFDNHFATY